MRDREAIEKDQAAFQEPESGWHDTREARITAAFRLAGDVGPLLEQLDGWTNAAMHAARRVDKLQAKVAEQAAEIERLRAAIRDARDDVQSSFAAAAATSATLSGALLPAERLLPGDSERCPNCHKIQDCCGSCSCGVQTGGQQE